MSQVQHDENRQALMKLHWGVINYRWAISHFNSYKEKLLACTGFINSADSDKESVLALIKALAIFEINMDLELEQCKKRFSQYTQHEVSRKTGLEPLLPPALMKQASVKEKSEVSSYERYTTFSEKEPKEKPEASSAVEESKDKSKASSVVYKKT